MPTGLIIKILVTIFFTILITLHNKKEKEKEKKRFEESERERNEDRQEMLRLKLDEKEYNFYKLKKINNTYLLDSSLKENFPSSISIYNGLSNKKIVATFDTTNNSKVWDNADSKLIFILFNCSKIISFDSVDYKELICNYCRGQFINLLTREFQEVLLSSLEAKTIQIKNVLKENNITEPQTVSGLVNINFDHTTIREIKNNSRTIVALWKDIERINKWLTYNSNGSKKASDWARRKEGEMKQKIYSQEAAQEAKGIYYLNELMMKQCKISIIENVDKYQNIKTREVQLHH